MRDSIQPTYDSRETGPRYWVTTIVDGRTIGFRQPLEDPFARTVVTVSFLGLLRALFRGGLKVEVIKGAEPELMNDVLELDANQLVPGRTRKQEFRADMHKALSDFVGDGQAADRG